MKTTSAIEFSSCRHLLAMALDPALMFRAVGLRPDPWQQAVLRSQQPRILLNCCRQAGKSTTVAALALHTALFRPRSLILLVSRSLRQSTELFRRVRIFECRLGSGAGIRRRTQHELELANGSRVISLPGRESNLRSYSGVDLLIIDEAARVPDELYRAVRPMLAVSEGRLICLSTPFGRRGFFFEAWHDLLAPWQRFETAAKAIDRISPDFLEEEKRELGPSWFEQEYCCSFAGGQGLVYPDIEKNLVTALPPEIERARLVLYPSGPGAADQPAPPASGVGRLVGGIDFGFRNPFAAVWGILDRRDVLWIVGEHYRRQRPLHEHALALPRAAAWYADPAGANEIAEFRCAGFVVRRGENSLRAGIAAVTARLETGRLKILASACPNLVREARLYSYAEDNQGEDPLDEHNHALAALRYLVASLDTHFVVRFRRHAEESPGPGGDDAPQRIDVS